MTLSRVFLILAQSDIRVLLMTMYLRVAPVTSGARAALIRGLLAVVSGIQRVNRRSHAIRAGGGDNRRSNGVPGGE